jgi:hypothetical protein
MHYIRGNGDALATLRLEICNQRVSFSELMRSLLSDSSSPTSLRFLKVSTACSKVSFDAYPSSVTMPCSSFQNSWLLLKCFGFLVVSLYLLCGEVVWAWCVCIEVVPFSARMVSQMEI